MEARWMRQRAAVIAALASIATAHNFPYVPTQILTPSACSRPALHCDGPDVAYVFSQTDDGVSFRELNFSSSIGADIHLDTITETLPFLEGKAATTAFGATRTANGTLIVYAGDCNAGTGDVWSYQQGGEWQKRGMGDDGGAGPRGPYFLGGTMAFSSTLAPTMDQPAIYTYGGMCVAPDTDAEQWQQGANYTKSMLSLEPTGETPDTGYTLSVASNSGPRTPIAGFTLTPLTPSMTNKSGIVTQQASYVLLGGHTSQAFINMSTAAVWNLPAESWTYVNIQAPDLGPGGGTELALAERAAGVDNVYSRSGHTAVLSEDGGSVVVLGGWAGDVNTPAEPQLAVLEMSDTYSNWKWQIPEEQPTGEGIYGHGAAVLPGNVMMVYGGWEMGSGKRRQASGTASPRFLNLTSMAWTTSYTNPGDEKLAAEDPDKPQEGGQPNKKKLGMGLGLGFGFAFIIAALIVGFFWYKKHSRRRYSRDQAARALSQDPSQYHEHDEMMEWEDDPWGLGEWYHGSQDPDQNGERSLGYETLRGNRGGAFSGPLPGLHIPRKPLGRQQRGGGYVPTAQRPTNFVAVPGQIHPIYEDEEEESFHQRRYNGEVHTPTSDVPSDPFQTPTATAPALHPPGSRGSSTPSPEGRRHDPEVQDWVSDVDAADAMLARMNTRGQGRISPTRRNSYRSAALRDDESRSGSNLSESARSATTDSIKGRKPNSLVPLALFSGIRDGEHQKPGSSSSSSYNTARSSFGALQAEGPSLLLGRHNNPGHHFEDDEPPSSPSKSKPRRGWLGSLRRVFSNSESTTPTSSREDMKRRETDLGMHGGDYEPGLVGLRGELLRRKQGRQDWEEGAVGESDWDIERAVEQRLVQVMFTVPKERLRVVNGADEEDGDDEEREGMVKPLSAVLVNSVDEGQVTPGSGGRETFDEKLEVKQQQEEKPQGQEVFNEKHTETAGGGVQQYNHPPNGLPRDHELQQHHHEVQQHQHDTRRQHHSHERHESRDLTHHHPRSLHLPPPRDYHAHSRNASQDTSGALLNIDLHPLEPRFSHETDDTGRRSSGVVMEAQAMSLTRERPRSRVLQMVNSFESMSREGSPSPTRGI